jgi:hypothetical protein
MSERSPRDSRAGSAAQLEVSTTLSVRQSASKDEGYLGVRRGGLDFRRTDAFRNPEAEVDVAYLWPSLRSIFASSFSIAGLSVTSIVIAFSS